MKFMEIKDEITMRLVHYFITEENYEPIIVAGVKNEIWLENLDAYYKIVRINSNYIHNDEQFKVDNYKVLNVAKQIKKKTFTFKINTLNVLLDVGENVNIKNNKNIDTYKVNSIKDLRKDDSIGGLFPKLKVSSLKGGNNINSFLNLTSDITEKNIEKRKRMDNIFSNKKIVITNILIIINVLMFVLTYFNDNLFNALILDPNSVKNGEVYRLFTSIFMHGSLIHLITNMFSLSILGRQIENFLGKYKFIAIYIISGLCGSMLSVILTKWYSLGASGAIFGLFSALIYFGYRYRIYFGQVIVKDILPVLIFNLIIGFTLTNVDNAAHIGGLVGGLFATMALGVDEDKNKVSERNGLISLLIFIGFMLYMIFK